MSHGKSRKHKKKGGGDKINWEEFKTEQPRIDNDNVEEEEESKDEADCCDRCLFQLFGYILLYVGILVLFFSERDHKYSQRDISYIQSNLQLLDTTKQKAGDINTLLEGVIEHKYPIHFIDRISNLNEKNMIVMDDRTDVSFPGIALKIHTEMFQWIEKEETIRKEGTTQTQLKYTYTKDWSSLFHDSSNFNKQDNHYNPQPTVSQLSTRNVWVDDIIIGQNKNVQFHLSKSLYTKLAKRNLWKNVTKQVAEYSQMETWEMRDGYLFRPYDKAESYYAEQPDINNNNNDNNTSTEETDDAATDDDDDGDGDDVLKTSDINEERKRLDKPRIIIGDIRMTVFSLDTRGEIISYLGGMKLVEDWNQFVLIPWKSPSNHKFVMVEYGKINNEKALKEFSSENVLKLWLSRGFTLIFMFIGFMILQNVLNITVKMIKLPIGPIPFQSWTKTIIAAFVLSVILWIIIVLIAYIVGIIHLALTLVVLIVIGLFLNNKTVIIEDETELKTKRNKKTQ